jgi:FkbH-like protein
MVRAEAVRRRERAAKTEEQFLASLELEVEVRQAAPEHLARVAQLIAKTNQFNLTSIRRSPEEVEALAKADDARILIARVADRFGDYGLVGVAVLRAGHAAWSLDTFLLSCRVLGRGVETAFLALAAEHLRREGAQRLRAHYFETPKNGPVAQLLPDHGFAPDGDAWLVDLTRLPAVPAHIRIR